MASHDLVLPAAQLVFLKVGTRLRHLQLKQLELLRVHRLKVLGEHFSPILIIHGRPSHFLPTSLYSTVLYVVLSVIQPNCGA